MKKRFIIPFFLILLLLSCNEEPINKETTTTVNATTASRFSSIPASHTGVDFINQLDANQVMSPLQYIYGEYPTFIYGYIS